MGNKYDRALEEKGHKEQKSEEKVPEKPAEPDRRQGHAPRQHPKFEQSEEE